MDTAEHAAPSGDALSGENTKKKKKKKRDKVRSAWISFAGRIVAQIVGAIATVALGVMVLHRYTSGDARPAPELGHDTYARPAASDSILGPAPVHVIVLTPGMLGLRGADERAWTIDRPCTPAPDTPASSAAHLDNGTFLSR
jgi:hypothetical protein